MAGGFAKDGAVQDQIDATIKDAVDFARGQLPQGQSQRNCQRCEAAIPAARRRAVPGVQLCVGCQEQRDKDTVRSAGYNRRGSKDSQLR